MPKLSELVFVLIYECYARRVGRRGITGVATVVFVAAALTAGADLLARPHSHPLRQ